MSATNQHLYLSHRPRRLRRRESLRLMDMMDGRIGAIRQALDQEGWLDTSILAYSAKYGFASVSFECGRPLSIRKFQYFLDNELPKEVFRGKGFLWFEDSEFKHIFHLSGTRFTINDRQWQTPPKNQLVFIGQNLKTEELKALLQACIVP